jgi:hypothetical protein
MKFICMKFKKYIHILVVTHKKSVKESTFIILIYTYQANKISKNKIISS